MHLSQDQTGNKTKVGNIHSELQTEVQLRRRLISRKERKHLETSRKGEVKRGADAASRGGRLRERRDLLATGRSAPSEDRDLEPILGSTTRSTRAKISGPHNIQP